MYLTRKLTAAMAGVTLAATGFTGVGMALAPQAKASPAVATVASTTCSKASATATITPGIKLTKPTRRTAITATFTASKCTKLKKATSYKGTIHLHTTTLTCISGSATGTFTAKSNTGKKASGTMTLKATTTPLKFKLTGKVTKGFARGSKITGTFTAKPVKGNCTPTAPLRKATIKNDGKFKL